MGVCLPPVCEFAQLPFHSLCSQFPQRRPSELSNKRMSKKNKTVNRAYGGNLSHSVVKERWVFGWSMPHQTGSRLDGATRCSGMACMSKSTHTCACTQMYAHARECTHARSHIHAHAHVLT